MTLEPPKPDGEPAVDVGAIPVPSHLCKWISGIRRICGPSAPASSAPRRIVADLESHLLIYWFSGVGKALGQIHRSGEVTMGVVGPRTVFKQIDRRGRQDTLAVSFHPGVARSVFGKTPLHYFTDRSHVHHAIWRGHRRADLLLERIRPLAVTEAVPFVLTWLEWILSGATIHPWIREAVAQLSEPRATLAQLTQAAPRQLREVFRHEVGMGPKRAARILRMEAARKFGGTGRPWSEVAYRCGYSDQAHLIREHRVLGGFTPSQLWVRTGSRKG